jgi:hypothetical protein
LPIREEIESALKNLKNNKAAEADSVAAELLKNDGSVDALKEVILLAWTSETLPESWNKGLLCPVYKKGNKLDYTIVWYPTPKLCFSQANQRQTNSLH